ncbi:MAG: J domain-containing protein [Flexilinea sp.]|nr:J domain-containing protein [Flexilinea sp.]
MIEVSDDLYGLLEVSPSATQDEIKKAYFAAAKKYHPDIYHGPDAEQRFKRINSAYEILKDPIKRAEYDSFLNTIKSSRSQPDRASSTQNSSPGIIFDPVDVDHNLYTELDLELFAGLDEIKKAYKTLLDKYNPDVSLVPNAREKVRKITFAFSVLSDPIMKERYDYLLRIIVRFSPQKAESQNYASSGSTSRQTNGTSGTSTAGSQKQSSGSQTSFTKNTSYTTSVEHSSSNNSGNSSSSSRTYSSTTYNSSERDSQSHENYSEDDSNKGCRKALVLFVIFVLIIYLISTSTSDNKSSSGGNSSYYQATSSIRRTATPTAKPTKSTSNKSSPENAGFSVHGITLEVGKEYQLNYYLPNNGQEYTYSYGPESYISISSSPTSPTLIIKGLQTGRASISLNDEKNKIVDTCNISVINEKKKTVTSTPTKKLPTKTPSPISEWSFDQQKISIKVGESIDLHFTTPIYARYTYIPENYGIFTYFEKDSKTLTITGAKFGTGKIILRNEWNAEVASCIITVTGTSNSSKTPTPLANRKGGYTEQELIQNGYVGTRRSNGEIYYPGFYKAPDGNFYPTGN